MTTDRLHISPEALLEHHEWMRALARKLVATPGGAEDVVQDVWVQALERPPGSGWPLRAWLAGVLRNIALQRGREHARRVRREQLASSEEAAHTGALERLANHQDVVKAVLDLREPFRSTIVMRFYEGFPPRKIARSQNVSVATVKSRLSRGLTLLRERFAREYGSEDRAWALALVPLAEKPAAWGTSLFGGLLVKTPLIVAVSLVAVTATWIGSRAGERSASEELAEADLQESQANALAHTSVLVDPQPGAEREPGPALMRTPPAKPAKSATGALTRLAVDFVRADRKELRPRTARLVASSAEGSYTVEVRDSPSATIAELPLGLYDIEVDTAGEYRHVPQQLDLRDRRRDYDKDKGAFEHRVTLWPDDWIPVLVRTPSGKPFAQLAKDQGYEPKNFFVNAFHVVTSPEPIDPETVDIAALATSSGHLENEYAIFRDPPGHANIDLGGSVAGSLQLLRPPPLWAGLWLHGTFLESKYLGPADRELYFEIDLADLDARFASVHVRLLEKGTLIPVQDAAATLKADNSSHRRQDLSQVAPDEDGHLHFRRIIPGRHELTIQRAGHLVQRRLELAPGEALELGDLVIGSGPGIRVIVVDENGDPARAWLELAPFREGASTDELYHPNLHRTSDEQGLYLLPVPEQPSILRVRHLVFRRDEGRFRYGGTPPVSSGNVHIDPEDPPLEIRIAPRPELQVHITPIQPFAQGEHLRFVDELGLIVETLACDAKPTLRAKLLAGNYVLQRWNGEDHVGSTEITVDAQRTEVVSP